MRPTKETEEIVKNASVLNLENARKWAELFKKIPIYQDGWTTIADLFKDDFLKEAHDKVVFRINFEIEPHADHGTPFTCYFFVDNKASIEHESTIDGHTDHISQKDFFGFFGTWDEVVRKVVEMNNFLMNPAPLFTF